MYHNDSQLICLLVNLRNVHVMLHVRHETHLLQVDNTTIKPNISQYNTKLWIHNTLSGQIVKSEQGERSPLPFPPAPFLSPYSSPSLPSSTLPLPSLRCRSPTIQTGGLGECCKLPQPGLGQSPSRQMVSCILALNSDIWWQQF